MCLVALALGQSARFPLVLAASRDEFFARPTAPLAWWTPDPLPDGQAAEPVLGGRNLQPHAGAGEGNTVRVQLGH